MASALCTTFGVPQEAPLHTQRRPPGRRRVARAPCTSQSGENAPREAAGSAAGAADAGGHCRGRCGLGGSSQAAKRIWAISVVEGSRGYLGLSHPHAQSQGAAAAAPEGPPAKARLGETGSPRASVVLWGLENATKVSTWSELGASLSLRAGSGGSPRGCLDFTQVTHQQWRKPGQVPEIHGLVFEVTLW